MRLKGLQLCTNQIYSCHGVRLQICNVDDRGRLKKRVVVAATRVTVGRDNGATAAVVGGGDDKGGVVTLLCTAEAGFGGTDDL
ncbi:hypothetical protein BHE74_00058399 [Ensete ventricosum]|nr:hypothetical protein GW17_00016932 [Ensete ventricosum]RWW36566.1 hypothetical protein BHE74_00058399 [Ensete ventricosum]